MKAEKSYLRAVDFANAVGDVESGTVAQPKLGEVYLAQENKRNASD
jgi:hypothetical protein